MNRVVFILLHAGRPTVHTRRPLFTSRKEIVQELIAVSSSYSNQICVATL